MSEETRECPEKPDDPNIVEFTYFFDRRQLPTQGHKKGAESRIPPPKSDDAIKRLYRGNQDFAYFIDRCRADTNPNPVSVCVPLVLREVGEVLNEQGFPAQLPFAAVLGCVDARAPVELLFSQGFDDLYITRVAGNTLGPDCAGSLHYALHSFAALRPKPTKPCEAPSPNDPLPSVSRPLRLIVSLGHADCGAVTAAVKTFLGKNDLSQNESEYLVDDSVRGLLGRIDHPGVNLAAKALNAVKFMACEDVYQKALIELSVYVNAAWSAHDVQAIVDHYCFLEGVEVKVRYGVFDPRDCYVRSVDGYHFAQGEDGLTPPSDAGESLSPPPANLCELYALARTLAQKLKEQHDSGPSESLERFFHLTR